MAKETILVTGGAGFIGSHTCDALLEKRKKVICLDNFNDYYSPKTKRKNIEHNLNNPSFFLEKKDIIKYNDLEKVFEKHKIDKIIHLAARAGVRASLENPGLYEETNVKGTLNLLELAVKYKIKNFVFGSSSSVYGKNMKVPFSEEDSTDNIISPYAATKRAGEILCKTYNNVYGLNVVCLRFFTVYGPRGRPDMAPYIFTKNIYEKKPIVMFGDGSTKRDYTYVLDIVDGVLSALDKSFDFEIINLGNSQTVKLKKFISVVEKILNKKAKIIQKEIQTGDVPITYADISKAKKLLNYEPKTVVEKGMSSFISWFLENSK